MVMVIQGSPAEIQEGNTMELVGWSKTASSAVLSPSSIVPAPSSHYAFIHRSKNSTRFSKMSFSFYFLKIACLKLRNLKL
jgi:hypothetical protein